MFALLFTNLIPLYLLIALGFIGGKWLKLQTDTLATLAIFILTPVVVFGAVAFMEFKTEYILLPLSVYITCCLVGYSSYRLSNLQFHNSSANLIGMASGTGNTGYFGLPIILALFGYEAAGIYILTNFAIILYEVTLGYYIGARGNFSKKDSLKKIFKLPILYALILGLIFNYFEINLAETFDIWWKNFTGAWTIIGMMIIGTALAAANKLIINYKLIAWFFGARFLVWPAMMLMWVFLDIYILQKFDQNIHTMLLLIGCVPLASNTVAFAAHLGLKPEEAAPCVLLSTLFALFFIPFMLSLF
jgi:predicted permease